MNLRIVDNRISITLDDFREKFCNECYWQENGRCDIEVVGLVFCCNSRVDQCEYKVV